MQLGQATAFRSCPLHAKEPAARSRLQTHATAAQQQPSTSSDSLDKAKRNVLATVAALAVAGLVPCDQTQGAAHALGFQKDLRSKRKLKIPESEYKEGPEGLKYYEVSIGKGPEAKQGARVAVHYDAKWKGITFQTSRQGMGVTGGTPIGFDVGAKREGGTLPGLDLGVRGMRQGGQRKLLVPPNLAYGKKGIGEVPGDATLEFDVELLSVKTDAIGFRTKLVEG